MNVIEQLQTFWTSLQTNLPVLQNIEAIVAILIAILSVLYFLFRKIKKPSSTNSQQIESNPHPQETATDSNPHPQETATPINEKLISKITLHLAVKQIHEPYIFQYSDMPKEYKIEDISRHLHYCIATNYITGSINEVNQIATLTITKKGRYRAQLNLPSDYL